MRTKAGSLLREAPGGRHRSPATMPGYLSGRPPRNKGLRYPADPPRVEEIIAVMRAAGERVHGDRVGGLIVVLATPTRHHLDLPPVHRQRRDHQRRPQTTRSDDAAGAGLRL